MKKLIALFFAVIIISGYGNTLKTYSPVSCNLQISLLNSGPLEVNQVIQILNTTPPNPDVSYFVWTYPDFINQNSVDQPDIVLKDTILPQTDTLILIYAGEGLYEITLSAFDANNNLICTLKSVLDVQDNNGCQTTSPPCDLLCNGDFEHFDSPIDHFSDYNVVDGSGSNGSTYYYDATIQNAYVNFVGSTDIFSSNNSWDGVQPGNCNTALNAIDVPTNFAGTQSAYSGNSYCGIFVFSNGTYSNAGYREYILHRLTSTLQANETYYVSYAVSLADNSSHAVANVDLAFGHGPLVNLNGNPSPNSNQFSLYNYTGNHNDNLLANSISSGLPPQINPDIANPYGILSNSNTWTVISGYYTAWGDEQMLAIGNFYPDVQTPSTLVNPSGCNSNKAYYYIDKVTVQHILQPINLMASSLSVCPGQSVTLTTNPGFNNYSWSTGQSGATLNSITVSPAVTTTYTVTVFDPVCNANVSESITVVVNPLPNASAGPDVTICGYGCTILDGSGGVSYQWSPTIALSDPTIENPLLCGPNVASSYTVTVTDANGCQNTDVVNVTFSDANFPPPVITGPDNLCCSDLTFSVPAGFDFYQWVLPSGVSITSSNMTGNIITITYIGAASNFAGQEICVQVTDPQGCVAQSCLTLQNCCGAPEPPSSTVSESCNPSLLSDLIANYSWQNSYTGATLHIQNDLILDQNLSLNNCIVYVDADRKIIVKPGITFNVARTTMQNSCDFMWEGIVLENDLSTVNITFQSKIWQAKNAVVSNLGGKYFLSESEFKNNYKSVVVNNYALVHPGEIKKCTFIGTNYGMLPPHNSDFLPFVGVEVNKVRQVTIGDATVANNTNIFRKLRYGILGNTSNLEIYNNKFEDIKVNIPFSNFISNNTSIAIWAQNGYNVGTPFINIGNTGGIAKNTFSNCTKGIQIEKNFNVTVNSNEFTNTTITNIYCRSINGKVIDILNNYIQGKFGVGVLCIDFLKTILRVNNNTITEHFSYLHSGGYRNTGIWLNNVIPNPNIYEVKENIITRCENGIDIASMPNVIIKDNSVTYTRTNQQIINLGRLHAGIRLYNSQRAEIGLNTVARTNPNPANNGTSALTPYLQGIIVELSEQSYVHDNNIQQMGYGMYWRGSSINSTISCNIMEKCWNGIFFDNAEIGNQGSNGNPSGNYWVTNQDQVGGNMTGALNVFAPQTFWYAVYALYTNPNPQTVNSINFTPVNTTGTTNCQIMPGGTTPGPIGPGKRETLFGSILRNEKQFVNYADENRQQNNRYLYRMLKDNPSWINLSGIDDADYQNFYTTLSSQNAGMFEDINDLIADTSFSSAQILNNNVITNFVVESNQKTVNQIYLDTWANGIEIDSVQYFTLEGIACQNPLEGGAAVYGARVMLGLDYECANGANRSMLMNEVMEVSEKDKNFIVYPNPSSGNFTLINNGEEMENGKIQVIDITGKIVTSFNLNSIGETKLDLSNFSEGMYYYLIISNNIIIHSDKLIIER